MQNGREAGSSGIGEAAFGYVEDREVDCGRELCRQDLRSGRRRIGQAGQDIVRPGPWMSRQ